MKRNIWIIIAVVVLMAVAAFLVWNSSTSTIKGWETEFAVEDTSTVTKIFIVDKNDHSVTLAKQENGEWLVNGKYLAHDAKIESLLSTLHNLSVRAPAPLTARNSVISRMATVAKKIEVYRYAPGYNILGFEGGYKERLTKTFYVGDETQDNMGTYMLMEGSDNPFIIYLPGFRGFVSARFSPIPTEWRDHTVFSSRFKDIASVTIEYPWEPEKSFRVVNNEDRSQTLIDLQSGKAVPAYDTARMLGFMTSFHDIRFESFLGDKMEPEFIDSVLSTKPSSIITLREFGGDEVVVKTYFKEGFSELYDEDGLALEPFDLDRAYASINDDEDFVLIQYFVFDKVMRTLQYFTREE